MTEVFKFRKYWHDADLRMSFTVQKKFGVVGISLTRDEEEGAFALRLGFASFWIGRDAWSWQPPKWYEEWRMSAEVHSGRLWVYGGRIKWAKGKKDWPRAFRLPWFEWKYLNAQSGKTPLGTHPYTYQWKYKPEVVQHVTVELAEETRMWQLTFARLPLPFFRTKRSLWAEFSEEMGSERGSWKGGTVGAGFDLNPKETWANGLKRMQKERNFCRR